MIENSKKFEIQWAPNSPNNKEKDEEESKGFPVSRHKSEVAEKQKSRISDNNLKSDRPVHNGGYCNNDDNSLLLSG